MTDRILALVDGSPYAESVCRHAAWAASRLGAGVDLLHVLGRREALVRDLSGALGLGARTALLGEMAGLDAARAKLAQATARALLDDAGAFVEAHSGAPVTRRLRQGDLLDAVAEMEPDTRAVVICKRGIGKRGEAADVARGHLGSNMKRIVRASRLPVLVASRAFRPIARAALAFDASASVARAVGRMVGNPVFEGLDMTLVHAGAETPDMRDRLDRAVRPLADGGLTARAEIVPGELEAVLGVLARDGGIDLLVMGAYGHSRIRSLVVGSTTTAVIAACRVPVLLYR